MYSELSFSPMYKSQSDYIDIFVLMRDAGYRLYGLYDVMSPRGKGMAWGDGLFLSPQMYAAR